MIPTRWSTWSLGLVLIIIFWTGYNIQTESSYSSIITGLSSKDQSRPIHTAIPTTQASTASLSKNILPPADWAHDSFLASDPSDGHDSPLPVGKITSNEKAKIGSPNNEDDVAFCSKILLEAEPDKCPEAPPAPECQEMKSSSDESTAVAQLSVPKTLPEDRPLIVFAYYETEFARDNLQFFVDHALHGAADFLFILNGETDAEDIIFPKANNTDKDAAPKHDLSNVMVIKRENTCYDLGAHHEVLNSVVGGQGWIGVGGPIPSPKETAKAVEDSRTKFGRDNKQLNLRDRYKRYILMNASIRGPFMPPWSTGCWSDAYLNKVTPKVKLVGMSYNCHAGEGHVQSMIWATDSEGLNEILKVEGIGRCFESMKDAMRAEVDTTPWLRSQGYEVDVMLSVYHSQDKAAKMNKLKAAKEEGKKASDFNDLEAPGDWHIGCVREDFLKPVQDAENSEGYYGTFVHPYENLFMKSNRHIEDITLERLTDWTNGMGYESWDHCH